MALLHIVLFAAIIATSFAEIAEFKSCSGVPEDACSISEVRVTPCTGGKICAFRRRTNATISFDFTPKFTAERLETAVFWASTSDIRFADFGSSNGCEYTTCPTEANKPQTLNYGLYINKKMGKSIYPLKWKVWNADDDKQVCCLMLTIRIQ